MRRVIIIFLLLMLISGCSSSADGEHIQTEVGEPISINENQQLQILPFINGEGNVTIILEDPNSADFIVTAEGLDPKERYQIVLEGGMMFGPEDNVRVRVGSLNNETEFSSNAEGELWVSMVNPLRLIQGKDGLVFRILNDKNQTVMSTRSFYVN